MTTSLAYHFAEASVRHLTMRHFVKKASLFQKIVTSLRWIEKSVNFEVMLFGQVTHSMTEKDWPLLQSDVSKWRVPDETVRVGWRKFQDIRSDINYLSTNFHRRLRKWPQNWYYVFNLTRERHFVHFFTFVMTHTISHSFKRIELINKNNAL